MELKKSSHIFPIQPKLVVNHVLNTFVDLKIGPLSRSWESVSAWLLKNVFWFAIYFLGSSLTIWLCLFLFSEYSSAPILTRVTANTTNMVPLPNITVCVPFNASAMFPFNSSSATTYSDSIEDFFKKTIVNGRFNTKNYVMEWKRHNSRELISNATLFILHKYLTIMHEAEYLREAMENPFTNLSWKAESDQKYALLNILVPRIQQMNITTDEIKNMFIEYFKIGSTELYGYEEDAVSFCIYRLNYYNRCNFFKTIAYLDQNQICFKMHNVSLQAEVPFKDYIMVAVNDHSNAINMTGRKIIFNFNGDATPPNFAAASDESSFIEMTPGDYSQIFIDYESVYRMEPRMPDETLRCSDQTHRECEENCIRDLVTTMCNCTPATFSIGQSDENKCTLVHYTYCLNYSGNEDDKCRKNCPVSCNQTSYKISKPYVYSRGSDSTRLTIKLNKYDYLIYEEYFKWEFLDLISVIGGALGIWLGIDFIVLIQFIFTLVAKFFRKVLSLTNLEAATSEDEQFNINESVFIKVLTTLNIEVPPDFTRVSFAMWLIEKSVWAIIYLVGGVLTAQSCKDLYVQYRDSGFKTSMHVSFNKSISLPPATLCLEHNIYYYNINPSFAPSSKYTDTLSGYLNQKNISKESILQYGSDGSSWPNVMVYVVSKYLVVLYGYDYDYDFEKNNGTVDRNLYPINEWQKKLSGDFYKLSGWADEHCRKYPEDDYYSSTYSYYPYSSTVPYYDPTNSKCRVQAKTAHNLDCSNAIENVLIPKLTELNITLEELRQKLIYQLNSDTQLTFRFYGSNENTVINNLRAAVFGDYSYCMYIPLENFEYRNEKDYAEIAIGSNIMFLEANPPISLTFYKPFSTPLYLSINEKEIKEAAEIKSEVYLGIGESKSISVRINYKMDLEPDLQKCANVKSTKERDMLYRIQYIEEMCNCSPSSWPELLPSMSRMCTLQDYKRCLIFNESSWFYEKRNDTSGVPCERIKVDIITENKINDDETNKINTSISRLRIRVEDFVYMIIKEEMTMTFVDFAVAFGGTLGILLGLDFRFIAWLIFTPPFFLISQLLNKLLNKKPFFLKPMKNTKIKTVLNGKFARLIASIWNHDLSDILKLNKFAFIKKMSKNAYWLIYYTTGGMLTFLMLKSLVINYMGNKHANVKFEFKNNESISIPSPTICFPFYPFKVNSDGEDSNIGSTNFVQNYISGKTKTGLLEDEWNPAFINYVHSYIVQYGKYEWFAFDDFTNSMDRSAFFDLIDNMTNVMDITFEELRAKFGRELAKMYHLNIAFYTNTSNETTESLNIHTIIVEESKICYKPSMKSLKFNFSSNLLKITANGTLMRKFGKYFDDLEPITVDLNGRKTTKKGATILDATVLGRFGENTTVALEIETIIKAYPLVGGEVRCSNLLSLAQCRSSCIAETIQDTCKCLPRTIALTVSSFENAQFCTLADYKNCYSALKRDAFSCFTGCLESCERIRFNSRSIITESTLEHKNQVEVNLRVASFKYQYMEEQLMYTREEFIGEIGGALGVFLGLSSLMFIEFFYALLVRLVDICVTKRWAKVETVPELDDKVEEISL